MNYQSGEDVQTGDRVLIEKGRTPGTVETIIEVPEQAADWGLDPADTGVLIAAKPFGLVFWPASQNEDPVVFVGRSKHSDRNRPT